MKFEVGKTYKTKSGESVRIVCDNRKHTTHRLIGLIDRGNEEDYFCWCVDGKFCGEETTSRYDLVHPPREFWLNLYSDGKAQAYAHQSKKTADAVAVTTPRAECIKVREVLEGE